MRRFADRAAAIWLASQSTTARICVFIPLNPARATSSVTLCTKNAATTIYPRGEGAYCGCSCGCGLSLLGFTLARRCSVGFLRCYRLSDSSPRVAMAPRSLRSMGISLPNCTGDLPVPATCATMPLLRSPRSTAPPARSGTRAQHARLSTFISFMIDMAAHATAEPARICPCWPEMLGHAPPAGEQIADEAEHRAKVDGHKTRLVLIDRRPRRR